MRCTARSVAFGVTGLIAVLQGLRVPLALGGGAFLLWLAWRTWHAEPAASAAAPRAGARGLAGCFAGTLLLTLANPATIFSFIAIFGALGARGPVTSPWPMVAGVLLGSALWWLVLSAGVGALRERFDGRWRRRVNRVSAGLLAALALWPLAGLMAPAG